MISSRRAGEARSCRSAFPRRVRDWRTFFLRAQWLFADAQDRSARSKAKWMFCSYRGLGLAPAGRGDAAAKSPRHSHVVGGDYVASMGCFLAALLIRSGQIPAMLRNARV